MSVVGHTIGQIAPTVPYTQAWKRQYYPSYYPKCETNKKETPHLLKAIVLSALEFDFSKFYHIYTDGSKNKDSAGCGFFDPQSETRVPINLPAFCSVYTAELYAILAATEHLIKLKIKQEDVLICIDSQSAILAITEGKTSRTDLVSKIHSNFLSLEKQGNTFSTFWTPSHIGIPGNEIADRAANEGLTTDQNKIDALPVPKEISTKIKMHM